MRDTSMLNICRTGKRTAFGMLKDGYNSAIRYFYNNFRDGFRQVYILVLNMHHIMQDSTNYGI